MTFAAALIAVGIAASTIGFVTGAEYVLRTIFEATDNEE